MSLKPLAVAAVTVALVMTACSSSKSKSPSSAGSSAASSAASPSSAAGATTAAPSGQNVAADKALAVAAGLKLSDFPRGWTEQAKSPTSSTTSSPADAEFARCMGVPAGELDKTGPADYDSSDFKAPPDGNPTITGSVGYQKTAAETRHAFSIFAGPKSAPCLSEALTKVLNDELQKSGSAATAAVKLGNATVAKQSFPTVGDETVEYRVVIPITAAGQSITTYIDLVIATKGRAGFEVDFQNIGSAVSPDQEQKYVTLVAGRLKNT